MIHQVVHLCGATRAAIASALFGVLFIAAVGLAEPNVAATAPTTSGTAAGSTDLRFDRNGRFGVFVSAAQNLIPGQSTGGRRQVYLFDGTTGLLRLVSHLPGNPLTGGSGDATLGTAPQISADGKWVAFSSAATDLVSGQIDTNGGDDVFLWSRESDEMLLVSRRLQAPAVAGALPSSLAIDQSTLSADGRFLAFTTASIDMIAGQTATSHPQVLLFDRVTGNQQLVSHATAGAATSPNERSEFNGSASGQAISNDGRFVTFASLATDLVPGVTDTNGNFDVFLFDRDAPLASSLRLLSRRAGAPLTAATGFSHIPSISANGEFVVFISQATNLEGVSSDTNGGADVFRYDRLADQLELVSHRGGNTTTTGNGGSIFPAISGGGDRVVFESAATNLVLLQQDGNGGKDIFAWTGGPLTLISHATQSPLQAGNGASFAARIGLDGGVAFSSNATDLVDGIADSNAGEDAFVQVQGDQALRLLSHVSAENATGDRVSVAREVRLGGALAVFESTARNIVDGPINGSTNLYVHGSLIMADGFETGDFAAWSQHLP